MYPVPAFPEAVSAATEPDPAKPDRLVIYQDSDDAWRWHRVAPGRHGAVVAGCGDGYATRAEVMAEAARVNKLPYDMEVHLIEAQDPAGHALAGPRSGDLT